MNQLGLRVYKIDREGSGSKGGVTLTDKGGGQGYSDGHVRAWKKEQVFGEMDRKGGGIGFRNKPSA